MKRLLLLVLVLSVLSGTAFAQGLTQFSTVDFNGNPQNETIFADYDITIVNVWATWCQWCIYEMPHFSKLKSMLPDNMNFIMICDDATTETILAYNILEENNALDIVTLMATQEIHDSFLYQVNAYPTTFFLNSKGEIVGDPIIGVPTFDNDIAEVYYGCAIELWDIIKDY